MADLEGWKFCPMCEQRLPLSSFWSSGWQRYKGEKRQPRRNSYCAACWTTAQRLHRSRGGPCQTWRDARLKAIEVIRSEFARVDEISRGDSKRAHGELGQPARAIHGNRTVVCTETVAHGGSAPTFDFGTDVTPDLLLSDAEVAAAQAGTSDE